MKFNLVIASALALHEVRGYRLINNEAIETTELSFKRSMQATVEEGGICPTMIPPSPLPPDDSTCWQWWTPPADGILPPGAEKPPTGCNYEPCEAAVCACDSYCCETAWDLSCRGYYAKPGDSEENNYFVPGCSAKLLCCEPESAFPDPPIGGAMPPNAVGVEIEAATATDTSYQCEPGSPGCCDTMIPPSYLPPDDSTCWQWWDPPANGVPIPGSPPPPKGCNYKPCEAAVCACDSYCCNTAWDLSCRGYQGAQGDASENNYFVDDCSAKILCCEPESAYPDPPIGGATVETVTGGSVETDTINVGGGAEIEAQGCTPGSPGCCETMIPPSYYPPANSNCWLWWTPPGDGVMKPGMAPPTKGCDYKPCQDAVCACDPYCCDTAWDESCRGYSGAQGDATENNYFVDNCSAKILCCEDELDYSVPQIGGATVPIAAPVSMQVSQPAGPVTVPTVVEVPVAAPISTTVVEVAQPSKSIVEIPVPEPTKKIIEIPVPAPISTKVIEVPVAAPVTTTVKQIPVPVPVPVNVVKEVPLPVPVPVAPKVIPVPVPVPVVQPKVVPLPVPVPVVSPPKVIPVPVPVPVTVPAAPKYIPVPIPVVQPKVVEVPVPVVQTVPKYVPVPQPVPVVLPVPLVPASTNLGITVDSSSMVSVEGAEVKPSSVSVTIPVTETNVVTEETTVKQTCQCPPLPQVSNVVTTKSSVLTAKSKAGKSGKSGKSGSKSGKSGSGSRRLSSSSGSSKYSSSKYSSATTSYASESSTTSHTISSSTTSIGYYVLSDGCNCPCYCPAASQSVYSSSVSSTQSGGKSGKAGKSGSKSGSRRLSSKYSTSYGSKSSSKSSTATSSYAGTTSTSTYNNQCICNNVGASSVSQSNVYVSSTKSSKGKSGKSGSRRDRQL